MPIRLECDCGARMKVPDGGEGKEIKCPKCGLVFVVPEAAENVLLEVTYDGQWLLVDATVRVLLDGAPIGKGSIKRGVHLCTHTTLGKHLLEVKIPTGKPYIQPLQFEAPGVYRSSLVYSRSAGTFAAAHCSPSTDPLGRRYSEHKEVAGITMAKGSAGRLGFFWSLLLCGCSVLFVMGLVSGEWGLAVMQGMFIAAILLGAHLVNLSDRNQARRADLKKRTPSTAPPLTQDTQKCPSCAEPIKLEARLCASCGYRLSQQEQENIRRQAHAAVRTIERKLRCDTLRRKAIAKTWIAWFLIGLAILFLIGSIAAALDPKTLREGGVVGMVGAILIVVVLPGSIGVCLLRQAASHKKEREQCAGADAEDGAA